MQAYFQARHVVFSANQALLEGDVRVQTWRAHLRAERLLFRRSGEDRVEVDGPMTLLPCPCVGAPIFMDADRLRLDWERGTLKTLTVRGALLRWGGIPVFPLPWMQFRSEHSWGLLPPRIAFRGRDGLLLGAGIHAPWGTWAGLSLEPALYWRGGYDVLTTLRVEERNALQIRWDRRDQDLVLVQGEGRLRAGEGALLWSIDASRGARSRAGLIDLESSARLFDHGKVAWVVPWQGTFSSGLRGLAIRGGSLGELGPQVSWAGSSQGGGISWWVDGMTIGSEEHAGFQWMRSELRLRSSWWWGVVRGQPELIALGAARAGGDLADRWIDGIFLGNLRMDVPLIRPLRDGFWRMEPGVLASTLVRQKSGVGDGIPGARRVENGTIGISAMLQNFWVNGATRSELSPGIGWVWHRGVRTYISKIVLGSKGNNWNLQGNTIVQGWNDAVAKVSLEGGKSGGWRGSVRMEGQVGDPPIEARWWEGDVPWVGGWFSQAGWSGEAGGSAPLGRGVVVGGYGWMDLSKARWLGHRMEILYIHPCGCLRGGIHGAQRVGRDGLDLWASISLG